MSFHLWLERPVRSAWVPSAPSGRKPIHNGNDGTRTMTSLWPSRSTAMTSCAPQSENQRRSSCHRGDSPNARPLIRICSSGTEDFVDGITTSSSGQSNGGLSSCLTHPRGHDLLGDPLMEP